MTDGPCCVTSARTLQKTLLQTVELMWPTVSRPVSLGVGNPFGAYDQMLFFPFFCRKIALPFVLGRPLWREICSAICHWSESRRTLLFHLRLLGSLSVASYDSQGLRWKYSNLTWGVCILLRVWYRMILGFLIRLRNFSCVDGLKNPISYGILTCLHTGNSKQFFLVTWRSCRHVPRRKHRFPQLLHCCMLRQPSLSKRCLCFWSGNLFLSGNPKAYNNIKIPRMKPVPLKLWSETPRSLVDRYGRFDDTNYAIFTANDGSSRCLRRVGIIYLWATRDHIP
jgi:hypothetical protein